MSCRACPRRALPPAAWAGDVLQEADASMDPGFGFWGFLATVAKGIAGVVGAIKGGKKGSGGAGTSPPIVAAPPPPPPPPPPPAMPPWVAPVGIGVGVLVLLTLLLPRRSAD